MSFAIRFRADQSALNKAFGTMIAAAEQRLRKAEAKDGGIFPSIVLNSTQGKALLVCDYST